MPPAQAELRAQRWAHMRTSKPSSDSALFFWTILESRASELCETAAEQPRFKSFLPIYIRARYVAWQNSWLHCVDIRFWSLLDHASSSASSADEKIVGMQTSYAKHPCLPRMVAIAVMLSAPRYMFIICAVGGALHVVTRSPTSVWTHPRPRGRLGVHVSDGTYCTSHKCTFPMSGCWESCEEHFRLCGKYWPPSIHARI